jgi:O-antigen ligase
MDLKKLNTICFTICVVCIVLGSVLALAMIWTEIKDNEFVWKFWLTIGVFFLASALTLSVTKTLGGKTEPGEE